MNSFSKKLFFIYVAKNEEWKKLESEDWNYVSSMVKFFHWWIKKNFNISITIEADILPVIPGRLFDRITLSYLLRDHNERDKNTYHFYLAYFSPFWTDCHIVNGYATNNFGMIYWERPKNKVSEVQRSRFFADQNCARISHILTHELLRMKGKKKQEYFDRVHDLWDEHLYKDLSFHYYNNNFERISGDGSYNYITLDPSNLK